MYVKEESIPIKDTPSFCHKNLSIISRKDFYKYVYVSRNTVNLITIKNDDIDASSGVGGVVEYIVPKCTKDGQNSSISLNDQICLNIIEAKIIDFKFIIIIIILTTKGVFVSAIFLLFFLFKFLI
jgi:hypothetical protein